MKESNDKINHPAHYTQGGVERIEAIAAAAIGLEGMDAAAASAKTKNLRWFHRVMDGK